MRIYVVIPVHNRQAHTRGCLRCLAEQTYRDFATIVVDDGSTDGTGDMIRDEFPDIVVLRGDGRLWWTGAANEGIRYALTSAGSNDAILMLNDDLLLPRDYIEKLVRAARAHADALIGSVVTDVNDRETIHSGGYEINWWTAKGRDRNRGASLRSFLEGHCEEVSVVTGRGVLIPCEVFREIGLYDRRHFLQHGDTELGVRARKAGYRVLVSYDAVVWSYTRDVDPRHINHTREYYVSDIRRYFFGIRSNMNLRDRFWFAFLTRRNLFQWIVFYSCDVARLCVHFARRFRLRRRQC